MSKNADVDALAIEPQSQGFGQQSDSEGNILNSQPMPTGDNLENDFSIILSRSLAKQLHNLAKYEGIHSADLILELVTEGIARRIMEDQTRQAPSHLMTRNGYVQDNPNAQPSMSHHAFAPNGNVRDGQGHSPRKNNFQRNTSSPARPQNKNHYNNNNRNSTNNSYNNGNGGSYFKPPKKTEF